MFSYPQNENWSGIEIWLICRLPFKLNCLWTTIPRSLKSRDAFGRGNECSKKPFKLTFQEKLVSGRCVMAIVRRIVTSVIAILLPDCHLKRRNIHPLKYQCVIWQLVPVPFRALRSPGRGDWFIWLYQTNAPSSFPDLLFDTSTESVK
jgi:hypothetical protein